MKRWLAALAPWMVVAAAHGQSPQAVNIDFTYLGIFKDDAVRINDDVYVAPVLLRKFTWEVTTKYQEADIQIGDKMFRVPMTTFQGRPMVNLSETVRSLGARTSFSKDGKTYIIRSWIRNIERTPKGIRIDGTMGMHTRLFKLSDPARLVIDLDGGEYDPTLVSNLPAGWRVGQLNEKTTRIVIEHDLMATQPMPALKDGRSVEVPLVSVDANQNIGGAINNSDPGPQVPPVFATLAPVQKVNETQREMLFAVPVLKGKPGSPVAEYISPTTLRITIPGSQPNKGLNVTADNSTLLRSYSMTGDGKKTTTITINTARPMSFDIAPSADTISVKMFVPTQANGTLAGKVIIVDAGHGGKDPGTQSNGINEKDITLKVANNLAKALVDAGASVIRTRSDDTFVSLEERAEIANRNRAALFLSVHVNSNSIDNTASGSMTFFHNQEPTAMLLAACIQQEIVKLKQLPNKGTVSDTKIYKSGFSVLRNTDMPAVLVELGFVNHKTDRAVLTTAEFQRGVAGAVVRGVKVFLGMESMSE